MLPPRVPHGGTYFIITDLGGAHEMVNTWSGEMPGKCAPAKQQHIIITTWESVHSEGKFHRSAERWSRVGCFNSTVNVNVKVGLGVGRDRDRGHSRARSRAPACARDWIGFRLGLGVGVWIGIVGVRGG